MVAKSPGAKSVEISVAAGRKREQRFQPRLARQPFVRLPHHAHMRLPRKIIQRNDPRHHRRQRRGNLRIARIRHVRLSLPLAYCRIAVPNAARTCAAVPENSITVFPLYTFSTVKPWPVNHCVTA